jgi:hypothetical protein
MDPKVILNEIEEFAQKELEKYNLHSWKFVWDTKARCRYGQCRYHKREIGITRSLAMINTLQETKGTVLHEIAHALTGPGHGHDGFWKQKCLLVGARPERCYNPKSKGGNVNTLEGKYKLIHKTTGKVYRTYHRKPKKIINWETSYIPGKKVETFGYLKLISS